MEGSGPWTRVAQVRSKEATNNSKENGQLDMNNLGRKEEGLRKEVQEDNYNQRGSRVEIRGEDWRREEVNNVSKAEMEKNGGVEGEGSNMKGQDREVKEATSVEGLNVGDIVVECLKEDIGTCEDKEIGKQEYDVEIPSEDKEDVSDKAIVPYSIDRLKDLSLKRKASEEVWEGKEKRTKREEKRDDLQGHNDKKTHERSSDGRRRLKANMRKAVEL